MLDFMRRNANSWVMVVLFAVIIFVFAINFGPWAGNVSAGDTYAAVVNNKTISLGDFQRAYNNRINQLRQFRDYDETQADKDGLRRMVLEQLVTRELLHQLGEKHNLQVSPKILAEEIIKRVFGPDESFDPEEYKRRVNGYFQAPISQFEEQVQKELIAEQMANLLGTVVHIPDDEVKKEFQEQNTQLIIEFIRVDPEYFTSTRKITSQETAKFKKINQDKISQYYHDNISKYKKEKEVNASHILVKLDLSADDKQKAQKKARAEEILKKIKAGADFAKLAEKESQDPGSAKKGGNLGFFSHGMMVSEFSEVAFKLKKNEVSEIVESPFGYHIIKLHEIKPAQEKTLEQEANNIANILLLEQEKLANAQKFAQNSLKILASGKKLSHITLPNLANKAKNPQISTRPNQPIADTTTEFNLTDGYIAKIGVADKIIPVLKTLTLARPVAKNIVKSQDKLFALRLKSRTEPDMKKFAQEKAQIKNRLTYPRRRTFIQQFISDLKNNATIKYNQNLLEPQGA